MTSSRGHTFYITYGPYVQGIHRLLMDSPHIWSIHGVDGFFVANMDNILNNHSSGRWKETPQRSCDVVRMRHTTKNLYL